MKYQGFIKKSRTLDFLALHTAFNSIFPILITYLPDMGLGVKEMALVNIIGNAVLVFLRYKTNGAVGKKSPAKSRARGKGK